MLSIFSTQNLHTFLRRKYLRPPLSRPPGPPGRGPRRSPRSGRSPPPLRSGRSELAAGAAVASGALVSSAIISSNLSSVVGFRSLAPHIVAGLANREVNQRRVLRGYCRGLSTAFSGGGSGRGFLARFFNLLDLVQTLLLFVDAHGQELDHRLSHAQAA